MLRCSLNGRSEGITLGEYIGSTCWPRPLGSMEEEELQESGGTRSSRQFIRRI